MADPVHVIDIIEEVYGHGSDDSGRSEVMATDCLDTQESLGPDYFFRIDLRSGISGEEYTNIFKDLGVNF